MKMLKLFNSPNDCQENWLLAFLWALESNSINITFWTICHIITSEYKYEKLLDYYLTI